jgi:protein LTV1
LVHRSQKDPLIDVEDHGQMVLSEANPVVSHEDHVREQQKYGIDYDDDYDYLQHLKEPSNANNVCCHDDINPSLCLYYPFPRQYCHQGHV